MSYRELWLFRYTSKGTAGVREKGFARRREVFAAAAEPQGGRVVEFQFMPGVQEWDAMMILEYQERPPSASLVAGLFRARAAETIASAQVMELVDPEAADTATAETESLWEPAGQ